MLKQVTKSLFGFPTILLAASLTGAPALSQAAYQYEDEDTILVEKQPSTKIPYSKIVRKIGKRLFSFDTHKITHFGKGKRAGVVRNFRDYLDRSKYRVHLKEDKVSLKFTLNF
ncbi:MAG: hypothetical protein C9356_09095 [Oleiphilus sp.]|nr:MAG: hypothetical protein C9356_09095 [Oleiphilus sp.]